MPVVVYKTEHRCKICSSGHREEIDALLEKRSRGLTDEAGAKINEAYVLRRMGEMGLKNPIRENILSHWKRDATKAHSYFEETKVAADAAAKGKKIVSAGPGNKELRERRSIIDKILPGWLKDPWPLTADEVAAATQAIGMYEALQKFVKGEKAGITVDHALKGGDLATKRKTNDAAVDLMKMAGLAVGASVQAALGSGGKHGTPLKELGPVEHEVIEGKVIEDEQ